MASYTSCLGILATCSFLLAACGDDGTTGGTDGGQADATIADANVAEPDAGEPDAATQGTVTLTYSRFEAIEGAPVAINNIDGTFVRSVQTDASGAVTIDDMPIGGFLTIYDASRGSALTIADIQNGDNLTVGFTNPILGSITYTSSAVKTATFYTVHSPCSTSGGGSPRNAVQNVGTACAGDNGLGILFATATNSGGLVAHQGVADVALDPVTTTEINLNDFTSTAFADLNITYDNQLNVEAAVIGGYALHRAGVNLYAGETSITAVASAMSSESLTVPAGFFEAMTAYVRSNQQVYAETSDVPAEGQMAQATISSTSLMPNIEATDLFTEGNIGFSLGTVPMCGTDAVADMVYADFEGFTAGSAFEWTMIGPFAGGEFRLPNVDPTLEAAFWPQDDFTESGAIVSVGADSALSWDEIRTGDDPFATPEIGVYAGHPGKRCSSTVELGYN